MSIATSINFRTWAPAIWVQWREGDTGISCLQVMESFVLSNLANCGKSHHCVQILSSTRLSFEEATILERGLMNMDRQASSQVELKFSHGTLHSLVTGDWPY
jgi:hypothetical protein